MACTRFLFGAVSWESCPKLPGVRGRCAWALPTPGKGTPLRDTMTTMNRRQRHHKSFASLTVLKRKKMASWKPKQTRGIRKHQILDSYHLLREPCILRSD